MEEAFPTPGAESEVANLKIPPHSIEAEQSVLGGLLLSSESWERVADMVDKMEGLSEDKREQLRFTTRLQPSNKRLTSESQ